jgi:hypothetical protein
MSYSTPTLVNGSSLITNIDGSITIQLETKPTLDPNVGGGVNKLKELTDVVGAESGNDGYILQLNTNNTQTVEDDTYVFVPNNVDGGSF